MKKEIKETLDTKGKFRCVRFASGEVGLVDGQDNALQVLGQWDGLKFGARGFLHITNQGRSAYMDMKNGEMYAQMPEFMNIGRFELTVIGGYMCTRTRKIYETPEVPKEILQAVDHGMYLVLPFDGEPSDEIKNRMIVRKKPYLVCLLDGDDSGVYWLIDSFADDSALVMDDEGNYFHAEMDKMTRKAVKTALGKVEIDPRYEKVVLHEDGTAELTVFKGKVITKKLSN